MDPGVGIVYWPGLEPLLERDNSPAEVVEIEPQAFWVEMGGPGGAVRADQNVMRRIESLPQARLVHGVSCPVGSSVPAHPDHIRLFARTAAGLGAAWASEHLSFNHVRCDRGEFGTGFLLPPRQTPEGVEVAAARIGEMKRRLGVPFAFETGVNYLRPRSDEMPDGAFVAAVANAADCGILLDLHNIWTNEINGRQTVDEFLAQIPLDRVVELHVAGGFEMDGYWLDAHSGEIPAALVEVARRVVPALPNLGAMIYELMPPFIPVLGLEGVHRQLDVLHDLWALRRPPAHRRPASAPGLPEISTRKRGARPSPAAWEETLGGLVTHRDGAFPSLADLGSDPAVSLLRGLVAESRAGMIAGALKLTSRLLLLTRGECWFRTLLEEFHRTFPPRIFASAEAAAFGRWVESRGWLGVPFLDEVLLFERAVAEVAATGGRVKVRFRHDPAALLEALAEGRLPDSPAEAAYDIEVTAA